MTIPAARSEHKHVCGTHGTPGEVVGSGAREVLIGGEIAGRLTDKCVCNAFHASPIAEGAAMVLLHGLPAARRGGKTLDGGEIQEGDDSVLIGGASFSLPSFITINGDAEYQAAVVRDLYMCLSSSNGKALLASMEEAAAKGRKVVIERGEHDSRTTTDPPLETQRVVPAPGIGVYSPNDEKSTNGTGTDARIEYNPWAEDKPESMRTPNGTRDPALFHEMTHANDIMHGTCDENWHPNPGGDRNPTLGGERRAVGLSPYEDRQKYPFSENGYREERGYAPRPYAP